MCVEAFVHAKHKGNEMRVGRGAMFLIYKETWETLILITVWLLLDENNNNIVMTLSISILWLQIFFQLVLRAWKHDLSLSKMPQISIRPVTAAAAATDRNNFGLN